MLPKASANSKNMMYILPDWCLKSATELFRQNLCSCKPLRGSDPFCLRINNPWHDPFPNYHHKHFIYGNKLCDWPPLGKIDSIDT